VSAATEGFRKTTQEKTMKRFQIQVQGEWAGTTGGWRPGIAGTLNQTGQPDHRASTVDTVAEAFALQELVIAEGAPDYRIHVLEVSETELVHEIQSALGAMYDELAADGAVRHMGPTRAQQHMGAAKRARKSLGPNIDLDAMITRAERALALAREGA
jgi:hypothetical protein